MSRDTTSEYDGQKLHNKDLWKATGQGDVDLEIRQRKFGWIGHTLRKGDGEILKFTLLWNPQGSRKRGRQTNSWGRSATKEAGRSWNKLRFLAADRQKWKELVITYVLNIYICIRGWTIKFANSPPCACHGSTG
jgi:hypothetical protein